MAPGCLLSREADENTAKPQEKDMMLIPVTMTVVIVLEPVAYWRMVTWGLIESMRTSISDGMHIYTTPSTICILAQSG